MKLTQAFKRLKRKSKEMNFNLTIRKILAFTFIQFALLNSSLAHICQYSTYSDYLTSPNNKIIKQWTTVQEQINDSTILVPSWSNEDLLIIQLLIDQFPFSSSPLSVEKFEKYDGTITEVYDSQLKKNLYVASFWPGENHYGIIVQKNTTQDGVARLNIVANINDGDMDCNYFDDI